MTATADIITATRASALSIPIQSVTVRTIEQLKEGNGESTDHFEPAKDGFVELVWVVENGKVSARQVTTGIQGDELIEVDFDMSFPGLRNKGYDGVNTIHVIDITPNMNW